MSRLDPIRKVVSNIITSITGKNTQKTIHGTEAISTEMAAKDTKVKI